MYWLAGGAIPQDWYWGIHPLGLEASHQITMASSTSDTLVAVKAAGPAITVGPIRPMFQASGDTSTPNSIRVTLTVMSFVAAAGPASAAAKATATTSTIHARLTLPSLLCMYEQIHEANQVGSLSFPVASFPVQHP
jgi:hypothetical protein